jgi:predicted RNA binding protein YcfA (HicA-like mRNA interferase family)
MPKPPKRLPSDLPRAKVLAAVKRLGFALDREGGSHSVYKDPADQSRLMVIPRHSQVKKHLLQAILAGAGVSEEAFMAEYR